MPFSSGTFSLYTPGNPTVTGTTISSTWANNTLSDIATGLSTALLKDGSQTVTANIPMSGFKFTGLGVGTAVADSVRVSQVQNSTATYLTSVGGTVDAITATASPTPAAYVVGQQFTFIPAGANTGATTLNISGLGAGAVQIGGQALSAGALSASYPVIVVVSATTPVFQIVSGAAKFTNSLSGDVALNNTANYFTGPIVSQGTAGTWFASGTVTMLDTTGSSQFYAKLWDGTTVIASGAANSAGASGVVSIALSGYLASPAADIRISVRDISNATGSILYNQTGTSKDSTLSAIRIA